MVINYKSSYTILFIAILFAFSYVDSYAQLGTFKVEDEIILKELDSIRGDNPELAIKRLLRFEKEVVKRDDPFLVANVSLYKARILRSLDRREESAFANMNCAFTLLNHDILDSTLISRCYNSAASDYFYLGLFDLAKELSAKALQYVKDVNSQVAAYSLLAEVYFRQGDYENSLNYYDSCYQIDLAAKDTSFISSGLAIIGRINTRLGRKDEGLALIQEAFDVLDSTKHRFDYSVAYNARGLAYSNLNEFDSANVNIIKALRISEEINNEELILNRFVNLCNLHTKFNKNQTGYKYCQKCVELMDDHFEPNRHVIVYQNLGKLYHALGLKTKARESLSNAMKVARKANMLPQMKEIYKIKADHYIDNGQAQLAFDYMEKYQQMSDSIFSLNAHVKANALKFKYEAVKKEAHIQSLRLNNKLKDRDLQELKSKQKSFIIFSLFIVFLGLLSFLLYREKKKAELEKRELKINNQLSVISTLQKNIARALDRKTKINNTLEFEELNALINDNLTPREYEILELILAGSSNQEIADKLFLSVNTIKFHLKKIYSKLDVSNRLEVMQLLLKK